MKFRTLFAGLLPVLSAASVLAAEPTIHISVGGEISPGVYGRVDFGNAPPPPVVYPQPVVIVKPVRTVVAPQPVYMSVPPGHARNWSKHCKRYDACGVPVYFVRTGEYERKGGRGHGKGHGKHGHDD